MTWLTPIWLCLLLPWAAAYLWVGRMSGTTARVPFLHLWPAFESTGGSRRRPPVWMLLLLAGLLAMILAAAGPAVWRPAPGLATSAGRPVLNAGIDRFAITPFDKTSFPMPPSAAVGQAMVSVFNGTPRPRAVLRVDGFRQAIDLPPAGQSRDYFIDLPVLSETSEAELLGEDGKPWADDVAVDNHADLARTASPARIEPRVAVSDDLARMIAVYQHHRPAGPDAPAVVITQGDPQATPAVVFASWMVAPGGGKHEIHSSIDASHPITELTDFTGIDHAGYATAGPPGEGWRTLIRPNAEPVLNNVAPLLAVRETPARQIWIGFDPAALAGRADYVIFWTNVFDWLSGGKAEYAAKSARTVQTPMPSLAPIALLVDPVGIWLLIAAMVLITAALVLGRRLTGF